MESLGGSARGLGKGRSDVCSGAIWRIEADGSGGQSGLEISSSGASDEAIHADLGHRPRTRALRGQAPASNINYLDATPLSRSERERFVAKLRRQISTI